MENLRVAFISTPTDKANDLAKAIVDFRLAACVNILPNVKSYYWWKGKVETADESLIVVKTTQQKVEQLITFVKKHHPHKIPEVVTMPVAEGMPSYVSWVLDEMGK